VKEIQDFSGELIKKKLKTLDVSFSSFFFKNEKKNPIQINKIKNPSFLF
jgi:hypothetical protein